MKWLRLLVLACLAAVAVCALAIAALLGPFRDRATDLLRGQLERVLTDALHTPVAIGALRLSLAPPHVEADGLALGPGGTLARVAHLAGTLAVRASLRQARIVASASADGVAIDVPGWAALPKSPETTPPSKPPRFHLDVVRVRDVRARLLGGAEPVDASGDELSGALEVDALGRLSFSATAVPLALARLDRTLSLQRATVAGAEAADGYHLTALDVVGDAIELTGAPRAPANDLAIRGAVDLAQLAWIDDALAGVSGRAELDVVLSGPLESPVVAGSVRGAALALDQQAIGDAAAELSLSPQQVTVRSLQLAGPAGKAEGTGDLQLTGAYAYTAELRWSSLDVRRVARLGEGMLKPVTADGRAELAGTLQPLTASGSGDGTVSPTGGGVPVAWRARANYAAQGGEGEVDATQGAANTVRARLAIDADRALTGGVDLAVAEPAALGAVLPIEDLPNLRGALTATARLGGRTDDPRVDGEVAGHDIVLLGAAIDRLAATFAADRSAVHIAAFHADLQPGRLDAAGTIALTAAGSNDLFARADAVAGDTLVAVVYALTGSVPPIGRGTLTAELRGRGPWSRLQLEASAAMEKFWLTQEWIERATIAATATWPQWSLSAELRNRAAQTLALHATGTGSDALTADAHAERWQLTSLQRGDVAETNGAVSVDARVSGPPRALNGTVTIRMLDLVLSGRRFGTIDVALGAARGRWQLRASALDGTVTLNGTAAADPRWPFTLNADWNAARLGQLVYPGADVWIVSSGSAQASGRLTALEDVQASASIAELRLANGPYQLDLEAPAHLQCRRGACTLDALALRGENTQVRASGTIGAGGAIRLTIAGAGDLRLLELAGRPIESARGRFTIDADVRRSAGRWDVEGQIALDDVGLDVGAPVAITRAAGRLTLQGSTLRIDRLGGRIGTGSFAIDGRVDLERGPDLTWTLTDAGADLMPSLEAELSGHGAVEGTWDRIRVAGDVRIARMLYDRDLELTDLLPSFNRTLAAAPRQPSTRQILLDLHIIAPGELYVENNLARIEGAADLRITGTADHPIVTGRIEGLDGQVTVRDRVFELQGATIDFRPDLGLTAALNISAESTIDTPDATYTVGVRVTGTTADPRVTLSSDDPALSQTDIATLIAVGKTTAQLREGGGGFSMYDALAIVPKQLAEPVTQRAQRLLPIDRISFEPTFSRTTGTFEPQLKLGKDLTDNLAVAIGQTFGVESRTIAEADYRLSPHVFVPISWESQTATQEGAFAAGVKLRYDFWRITPYTLLRTLR